MNKIVCLSNVFGAFIGKEDIQLMAESFVLKTYGAGDTIVSKGNVENYFYLVESGVQMLYIINKNGEKVVLGFSFPPSPTGAYDSFLKQEPSQSYFESLTPSSLWRVSRDAFEIFNAIPGFLQWKAAFAENILFGRLQREVELTTLSAKERFKLFESRIPKALLNIPQKLLASYLNMSAETFSRIRADRD